MPTAKGHGGGSGSKGRRGSTCSFCGKAQRDAGPMVEGPKEVFICKSCVELCHNIIKQEIRKSSGGPAVLREIPSPRDIHDFLNEYVIGQERSKRTLAVAVHNHYKRLQHVDVSGSDDVEIDKSNMLIVGPTGCGKTLLAKTLARLLNVPFAIAPLGMRSADRVPSRARGWSWRSASPSARPGWRTITDVWGVLIR